MTTRQEERIAEWTESGRTVALSHSDRLGLTVRVDGRLAGFALSTERAQGLVNELAGRPVWTATEEMS